MSKNLKNNQKISFRIKIVTKHHFLQNFFYIPDLDLMF